MSKANNIIDQMISSIHVPHASKTGIERALEQEKEQLKKVPLIPEENREERIKQILNYCERLIHTNKQDKFYRLREMYSREATIRINEIIRRAKSEIEIIKSLIPEIDHCSVRTGLKEIEVKIDKLQNNSYFQKGFRRIK